MYQEQSSPDNLKPIPQDWSELFGGERACYHAQRQLNTLLPELFGYYGVALGPLSAFLSVSRSPVKHWFNIGPDNGPADVLSSYDALPLASDSVDIALCAHVLEFINEPHQLLREIERIVIPDGHLILTGINPLSWYGGRHLGCRIMKKSCREKRLIGLSRIRDWLMLLGFSIESYIGLGLRQSGEDSSLYENVASFFTSHYFIIAKKCVSTITPVRPSWNNNRKLVPARFAEPSVRRLVERELKKVQN
ncbi:class I SAM-dependent methyltransferase [Pleionea sediminis]|uniref:class I SAM-dependent methyltransferase n=1 Tax=Pleionea sediminis TaxID=2569479 RepID=UPI001186CEE5|nr:class I SAM-dependent methyltransferase [Pleionea sediminis]